MDIHATTSVMRLADFIKEHPDAILGAWDSFASSNESAALKMDSKALRDHAGHMLSAIAGDLGTLQTREKMVAKSIAPGSAGDASSAAATRGAARLASGLSIDQLLAEYRALRSSVLRVWADHGQPDLPGDIDDIMRFNEALDQALAESVTRYATMISHSQQLLLAILGHDLHNPLNATVIEARFLMRMPNLDPACAPVVARVHRSGLRMGRLVDDLIDYTRTHLGLALPMSLSKSNMGVICRGTVEELRLANPERAIHVETGSDLDGLWDEGRIAHAFYNLLDNALQQGTQSLPITMRVESGGSDIVARIHNKGKAIDPAAIDIIFDPLVRFADPHANRNGGENSLGVGLYIARAIVEAHGGRIDVTSNAEHGTTFSVRVPRIPPAPQAPRW